MQSHDRECISYPSLCERACHVAKTKFHCATCRRREEENGLIRLCSSLPGVLYSKRNIRASYHAYGQRGKRMHAECTVYFYRYIYNIYICMYIYRERERESALYRGKYRDLWNLKQSLLGFIEKPL